MIWLLRWAMLGRERPTSAADVSRAVTRPVPRVTVRIWRAAEGAWYRLDPDTGTEIREDDTR